MFAFVDFNVSMNLSQGQAHNALLFTLYYHHIEPVLVNLQLKPTSHDGYSTGEPPARAHFP